ncbi:MAG: SixA phosphatase family protein [Flavobacteriales bacterium]
MKTTRVLHLIRHAKSDWKQADMSDHDRPLNKRGNRDAPLAAERFIKSHGVPDCWMSSTAQRAITTAGYFSKEAKMDVDKIRFSQRLYLPSYQTLITAINSIDNKHQSVVIFGHNPGHSLLASILTGQDFEMPTCSIVSIEFELDSWELVSADTGVLKGFDFPKKHSK